MCAHGYHYELGLMKVLFRVDLNSDAPSSSSLFDETERGKLSKLGLFLTFLDSCTAYNAEQALQEQRGYPWTYGNPEMQLIAR